MEERFLSNTEVDTLPVAADNQDFVADKENLYNKHRKTRINIFQYFLYNILYIVIQACIIVKNYYYTIVMIIDTLRATSYRYE